MKNIVETEKNKYVIIKDYKEAFNEQEFLNKYTSYFETYDYILGDIAYSKLRLKGFNKKNNKQYNKINDYEKVDKYLKENCAYDCKYFILEKIQGNKQD
ncbi:MAG: YutD family protein [Bacilli bacterium]|nr:YutD family protein [Bacilli bacterium]